MFLNKWLNRKPKSTNIKKVECMESNINEDVMNIILNVFETKSKLIFSVEKILLKSIFLFIDERFSERERTLVSIMKLLNQFEAPQEIVEEFDLAEEDISFLNEDERDELNMEYQSVLDILISDLKIDNPKSEAVYLYETFKFFSSDIQIKAVENLKKKVQMVIFDEYFLDCASTYKNIKIVDNNKKIKEERLKKEEEKLRKETMKEEED